MPHKEEEYRRRPELCGSITSSVANEAFLLDSSPAAQQQQQQQKKRHCSSQHIRTGPRRSSIIPTEHPPTFTEVQSQYLHQILGQTMADATILCDKVVESNAAIAREWVWSTEKMAWHVVVTVVVIAAGILAVITTIVWALKEIATL